MRFLKRCGVGVIVSVSCIAGYLSMSILMKVRWELLSAADWGTWVGAIGTVATLIGTIWLATSERRERLRSERNLALVTVSSLTFQIPLVRTSLAAAIATMQRDVDQNQPTDYANISNVLGTVPLWNREDLTPLVGLRDHLAARLAFVGAEISGVKFGIEAAAKLGFNENAGLSTLFNVDTIPRLVSPMETLDDAYARCRAFMEETGFSFTAPISESDREMD